MPGIQIDPHLPILRFARVLVESVWNRDRVKNVQITVAEGLGVSSRAVYYDRAGALRGMVRNHLTQVLTLTAMEAPAASDVLTNDQTLFVRADEVEKSWSLYGSLLDNPPDPLAYPSGTWGPDASRTLTAAEGDRWLTLP